MASIEELDAAIGAHGLWKTRLKGAIEAGKIDTPIDTIRKDDQCTFGRWLYGPTLTPADTASSHYQTVKALHADFHRTAARVAELAVGGRRAEAEKLMALGGEYSVVSGKLTQAMMAWRKVSR